MNFTQEYKLSSYQDYGCLGSKEHIHLVRNKRTGKICVKKVLEQMPKEIIEFRRKTQSSHFPKLLEVVEDGERVILIEEYIEGLTLEEYMMGERLPEMVAVKFAFQVCEALLCLHESDPMLIYRDLKPENLIITPTGKVKLIDFDISRKYQKGKNQDTELLGTASYAAPEQFGFYQTDNRTDIYAFGVMFNYMLTGKLPVEYVTEGKYEKIIRKCIQLEPDRRYQNVSEIIKELDFDMPTSKRGITKKESWVIPGFRSGVPWKILAAVLGYAFILYMGLTIKFNDAQGAPYSTSSLWLNRVMLTLAQFATVLFVWNYRGVSDQIRFYRHPSAGVRIISFFVTWIVFVTIAVVFTTIIEMILLS